MYKCVYACKYLGIYSRIYVFIYLFIELFSFVSTPTYASMVSVIVLLTNEPVLHID